MKISKALLSAILIGITVQATSCVEENAPSPEEKKDPKKEIPDDCPPCGRG